MNQPAPSGAYTAIRDFVINEAKYQQAKADYTASRKTLLALLPAEVGEFSMKEQGFTVTVKYPEKVKWDAEALDALYGGDKPIYVKLAYSIDLRDLRRLPQSERDQLEKCYAISPGTPAIDVVKE